MHGGPSCAGTASPKPPSLTLIIERYHIALSCICNLCFIHLQRNDPHACIACANGWFRKPLGSLAAAGSESATREQLTGSLSGDLKWLQGVWKLLEDAFQHRRCVEDAVHLAGYVSEALCMLAAPQAAVEVLLLGLSALGRLSARDHVRCLICTSPSLDAASMRNGNA
jgi:hypothetical protein